MKAGFLLIIHIYAKDLKYFFSNSIKIAMNITHQPNNWFSLPSPFLFIPNKISNKLIVTLFNQVFAQALQAGELDFLTNKWVLIEITDINLAFSLGLENNQLTYNQHNNPIDLRINAKSCDFLDMLTKKKDPDTLFFQRKIKMQGSTELGLFVKNFLDAFEVEAHWVSKRSEQILQLAYPVLSKLLCRNN